MDDFDKLKLVFFAKYQKMGPLGFYKYLLSNAAKQMVLIKNDEYKGILPHVELLNFYEKSLVLFRRDNNQHIFEMAKTFRRAAHKIYRMMINCSLAKFDGRFITRIK